MSNPEHHDAVPIVLFITAISMVLGAFAITIGLLINTRKETLINRQNGLVNQTYVRATNCFASTTPTKRTPNHVKDCYDKAEQATGQKVDRYGDGL